MKSIELLDKALKTATAAEWQRRLGLSDSALYMATNRGRLSPAIAGALAEQLGENIAAWVIVAALEGERDSACKDAMVKRFNVH